MAPTPFQKKTLWSALTGLSIVLLGAIAVGLIWLGGQILAYLQPVLVPLAVAGIIAYLLDPVVAWLEKSKSINRLRAVLLVLGSSTLLFGTFGTFISLKLIDQGNRLTRNADEIGTRFLVNLKSFPGARALNNWVSEYLDENGDPIIRPDIYRDHDLEEIEYEKLLENWRKENGIAENTPLPDVAPTDADAGPSTNTPALSTESTEPNNLTPKPRRPRIYVDADGDIISPETLTAQELEAISEYERQTRNLTFSDTRVGDLLQKNIDALSRTALNWLKATTRVFGFIGYLLGFILVPVYLFYFLHESAKIKETWTHYIPLKASKFKDEVVSVLSEINSYLISFFRGQVLVSLIDGILVGIALEIFRLPYGFLIGMALAVLGIIPFIGNILCMIPSIIIAYVHFSTPENQGFLGSNPWAYVGAVLAIFIIVQQINSLVTAPKIVGDSVGLHPMTVIFSIIFWSLLLGGFLGALLAVPLTAAVKVLFRRYLWETRVTPNLPKPQISKT